MAKQRGIIKLDGTLGGITFYQTRDGFIARSAGGFRSEALKTDPRYAPCRETNNEFASCASGSKLLKESVALLLPAGNGRDMHNRRYKLLKSIQDLDPDQERGKRHFMNALDNDGARLLLRGFEFNKDFTVSRMLHLPYQREDNRIVFDALDSEMIHFPKAATGACFQCVLARIDFAAGTFDSKYSEQVFLNNGEEIAELVLETNGIPEGDGFELMVLGICFFQEVNGVRYWMQKGAVIV